MSGFLIAVKSCCRDIGMHSLIREGWFNYLPDYISLRFFIGNQYPPPVAKLKYDEIQLDVMDDYTHLPEKVRAICNWTSNQHYDHVMLIDNDTFLHPERLLSLNLGNIDYFGKFFWKSQFPWATTGEYRFAFGGLGYILSHRAASIIADSPTLEAYRNEDEWVGRVLHEHRDLLNIVEANVLKFERYVTWHYPKDVYRDARYTSSSLWQRAMMYQHLGSAPGPNPNEEQHTLSIDDRKPFPDHFPKFRCYDRTTSWQVDSAISRLLVKAIDYPESQLLNVQNRLVSLSLVNELEEKPFAHILRSEWEALATAYKDLNQREQALDCAKIAYAEKTDANRIKLAQAYDFAGYYKQAHTILLNLYSETNDYNLLPLLRAAARRA